MATYLVTGVSGFIASRVASLLLEGGHEVVGVDNLNDYYDVRVKHYRLACLCGAAVLEEGRKACFAQRARDGRYGAFTFRHLDIENAAAVDSLFAEHRFEAVFNLAARAGIRYSVEHPHVYMSTNAVGTLNMVESMKRAAVGKLVLASTSSLYAGQQPPFLEAQPVNTPISPYAASKKAAEVMAFTYHHLYGLDVSVLRYFTVFGPAGRPDMSIFRFIEYMRRGQPLEIFGDGSQARDFTYLDDIARGTIAALRPVGFEVINLGGGNNPITLAALIEALERHTGHRAVRDEKPFCDADMRFTWADIAKASRLLGWQPEVSVEEGIRRTVLWHQEHADWLSAIKL